MRRKHKWKAARSPFVCVKCGGIRFPITCAHGVRCWNCFCRHADETAECGESFWRIFYGYLECRRALAEIIWQNAPVTWPMAQNFCEEVEMSIEHMRSRFRADYLRLGEPWGPGEEGLDRYLEEMRREIEDLTASPRVDYYC